MNKIVTWLLGLTRIGKIVEPVQKFLDGYKAYIAGTAILVPALATILTSFSQQGLSYLTAIVSTPEFKQLMEGWAVIALRAGLAKAQAAAEG